MLATLGIVHVPTTQTSASASSLLTRSFAGKPLLEWVVHRIADSERLDAVIVVADSPDDQAALVRVVPSVIPVFAPKERDRLATIAAALREFAAENVVLVGLETPFVDPVLIDRLVSTAAANPDVHYLSYASGDGRPAVESRVGVCAEWFRSEAIKRAHRKASDPQERKDVSRFIRRHPEMFPQQFIPVPLALDRDDVRLELSVDEDWDHAEAIFEALGPDGLEWQRIAGLLDHQPALRERMAVLNRAEFAA